MDEQSKMVSQPFFLLPRDGRNFQNTDDAWGPVTFGTVHRPGGTPNVFTKSHPAPSCRICDWSIGTQCPAGLPGRVVSCCHQHRLIHGGIFVGASYDRFVTSKAWKDRPVDLDWGSAGNRHDGVHWTPALGHSSRYCAHPGWNCPFDRPRRHHRRHP